MKNATNQTVSGVCKSILAALVIGGWAGNAVATLTDNFEAYTSGTLLSLNGNWDPLANWYGSSPSSTVVGGANGLGSSKSGATASGSVRGAIIPLVDPDIIPGRDLIINVAIEADPGNLARLVVGNNGLASLATPLHGNRIFFNPGGDATYQVGTSGDTANPKITGTDFTAFGWVQIQLQVAPTGGPGGSLPGLVTVRWRDINDTTGAPLAAYTTLGSIPQSYGMPTYFGVVTSETGTFDNLEIFSVPEPSSIVLMALGAGLVWRAQRRASPARATP